MLAFFLLWAARNHSPRVWLPIAIAMIGVGTFQAAFGMHPFLTHNSKRC
jgi:hypothetical protein